MLSHPACQSSPYSHSASLHTRFVLMEPAFVLGSPRPELLA